MMWFQGLGRLFFVFGAVTCCFLFQGESTEENGFPKTDALVSAVGADNSIAYSKSATLQMWLFGYELMDTIVIMTKKSVCYLASKNKINFLKQIEGLKEEDGVPAVKLFVRDKVCF